MSTLSLLTPLLHRASTPYAICIGTGLAASSYFFWGNVGCAVVGIYPAISSPGHRRLLDVDVSKSVELFSWFFEGGKIQFLAASGITFTTLMTAAFLGPAAHRNYHIINALVASFIAPWTAITMLPTVNKLLSLRDQIVLSRSTKSPSPVTTQQEQTAALELLEKWQVLHLIRTAVGGLSWLMCVGGLMMI